MKIKFRLLITLFILKLFCLIITEEVNKTKLNEEEQEQLKFQSFISEYRKNFSKINPIVITDKNYKEYMNS